MASSRDGQDRYGAQLQLICVYNKFLFSENRIAKARPDLWRCSASPCFEPRPNSRALGTAGSVITISLSIIRSAHSKHRLDAKRQDSLVQKIGLRWPQTRDAIKAEPLFSSSQEEAQLTGTKVLRHFCISGAFSNSHRPNPSPHSTNKAGRSCPEFFPSFNFVWGGERENWKK